MKNIKKAICVILTLIFTLSCFASLAFAAEEEYPVIYIKGQGAVLTDDSTTKGNQVYPIEIPDGYLGDRGKELIIPLAAAMATDNWKTYNEKLYNAVMPILSPFACDENGNTKGTTGSPWRNSTSPYTEPGTGLKRWYFDYDWRLDPNDCIDSLHEYIGFVKTKTGKDKVNIISRCLATNIVLAYAAEYGTKDIYKLVLVCPGFDGFETIDALFTGNIDFNAEALNRFSETYLAVEDYADDPTFETVRNIVTALEATPLISFTADTLNSFFANIRDDSYRRIVRDSYASIPSMWSYIGDDCYEEAKKFIFGEETEKYAGLIEKIDDFHYNVLVKYDEILDKISGDGTYIYNVCKYGFQMLPMLGEDYEMSDTIISTSRSSIGAVCSEIDKELSPAYLAAADIKYISPDRQIDASTCKYPEHTWFIKNMTHKNMPTSVDKLLFSIIRTPGYATVDEVENYPQFLMSSDDGGTIVPATEENTRITSERVNKTPLMSLIEILINFIKNFLSSIFSK